MRKKDDPYPGHHALHSPRPALGQGMVTLSPSLLQIQGGFERKVGEKLF